MEISAFEIALFTGVLGVGATLLGVIISYCLSLKLAAKQERRAAGAKLRAAFAPDLAYYFLLGRGFDDIQSVLITRQAPAVEEYRIYVSPERQWRYQKAWEQFYEPLKTWNEGFYKKNREVYRERIEAILKFAEPN